MTHPVFAGIPDQYVAETFSEIFASGSYKFNFERGIAGNPTERDYPPEPAYFTSVTAAFIARNGVAIGRMAAHGLSTRQMDPSYEELVDKYSSKVGTYQAMAVGIQERPELFGLTRTDFQFGALGEWAVEATKREGQKLIAAHVVNVTAAGRKVIDAFCYPRVMVEEFPLVIRQGIELIAEQALNDGANVIKGVPVSEELRKLVKDSMTNTGSSELLAGIAPASVMPTVASFRQMTEIYFQH